MRRGFFKKTFELWGILCLYVEDLTRRALIRPKNKATTHSYYHQISILNLLELYL